MQFINDIQDCFDNFIGIRGNCTTTEEPESSYFIDDLPGIDLVKAGDVADGLVVTGEQLLKKSLDLAVKQVSKDVLRALRNQGGLGFKSLRGDNSIKTSGTHTLYGCEDIWARIEIEPYCYGHFNSTKIFDIRLYVDRDVKQKLFTITTQRGTTDVKVDLRQGYNLIPFTVDSDSEYIYIDFDLRGFKVGQRENWYHGGCGCYKQCQGYDYHSCVSVDCLISSDYVNWTATNEIGFDCTIQCRCNEQLFACYFRHDLALPILFRAGINYIYEVLASDRVNAYVRNSVQNLEKLLAEWKGQTDVITQLKIESEYHKNLNTAIRNIESGLRGLCDECLEPDGSYFVDALPG